MKRGLIVAGFALMTVVALVGWTRRPTMAQMQSQFDQAQNAPSAVPAAYPTTPALSAPNARANYQQPVYSAQRRYSQPPVVRRASYSPAYRVKRQRPLSQRPLSHSVAIIVAGAGTGAAIGALAGHGRGAAVGALAGGAAGFIYDRVTHNR